MTLETFKILNNMATPVLLNLLKLRDNTAYNFRYNNIFYRYRKSAQPKLVRKVSVRYAAAVMWNNLPDEFRKESNFNQFKALISNWNGDDCKCNMCR